MQSMSGFGRCSKNTVYGNITVEISSLNCKFCNIDIILPNNLKILEYKIKKFIEQKVERGQINVNIFLKEKKIEQYTYSKVVVKELIKILQDLKKTLNLKQEISLHDVINFPDLIKIKKKNININKIWLIIKKILDETMNKLIVMREKEGKKIFNDMNYRIKKIEKAVDLIEKDIPAVLLEYKKSMLKNMQKINKEAGIDEKQFTTEFAYLTTKRDVTEEIIRLKSHLNQFKKTINFKNSIGHCLNFIIQEMHRETNTMASKINNFKVSHKTIEIKSEIEKIKEQIQNIE